MKQSILASPFKNVVAQFIVRAPLSLRGARFFAYARNKLRNLSSPPVFARSRKRRSNLGGVLEGGGLPRPDKSGLAMMRSEGPDEAGNDKTLEWARVLYEIARRAMD
ncbi:MAG: hypothetical protein WB564_06785 [Dehalococcoidia bacterium]